MGETWHVIRKVYIPFHGWNCSSGRCSVLGRKTSRVYSRCVCCLVLCRSNRVLILVVHCTLARYKESYCLHSEICSHHTLSSHLSLLCAERCHDVSYGTILPVCTLPATNYRKVITVSLKEFLLKLPPCSGRDKIKLPSPNDKKAYWWREV